MGTAKNSDIEKLNYSRNKRIMDFLNDNNAEISSKALEMINESEIKMNGLVLELDFVPDKETGIVPALADPPQFLLKDINGYFVDGKPH